jgi:hypothetical protein
MRFRATDLARPHWAAWGRCPPWSAAGSWSPPVTWLWSRGGQANFYLQSANSQIFVLTLQSEIRKFRRCTRPQITNPQIFLINPEIANPQISNKYCTTLSQNSPKICLCKRFTYVQIWIITFYAIFVKRKGMYSICGHFEVLSPQKSQKRFGPQTENPLTSTFAEGPQM